MGFLYPKGQSTTGQRLNAIQLNQSAYGNAVALVYGKTRIPPQLYWYGAFKTISHTEKQSGGKGGGGGSSTSFTYTAAVVLGLCEGAGTKVGTVYADKAQTTLGALGFTLFLGGSGPAPWSFLTTNVPSQAISYDHDMYVAAPALDLGDSAAMPNLNFEVTGLLPCVNLGLDESDPSDIILDYCTEPNHGAGFNYLSTTIHGTGLTTYQSYCRAMGFFLSPAETTQRPAVDFLTELLKMTNSEAVWSPGELRIVPYGDTTITANGRTYQPNLTPIYAFTDDDYIYTPDEDPVRVRLKPANEVFNIVRVEYLDRTHQYNTAIEEAKDEDDIRTNGERAKQTETLHAITDAATAKRVAQIILQRQLYVRTEFEFSVRADYSLLEPMDLVAINDISAGIVNQLVRIIAIGDDENDVFTITAEEMLTGPAHAPLYNTQAAAGYAANGNVAPGPVGTPVLFPAPPLLVGVNGGYEVWIGVTPSAGNTANWGGCQVYASLDGVSYSLMGNIYGAARTGQLTALLAATTDPDDTTTLHLAFANPTVTTGSLASGSQADEDNLRTLLWVDGEILSYRTATLTGAGAYDLLHMRRGKYGSAIAAHANLSRWARLDEKLFRLPYDPGMLGKTISFKFPSFNIYGRNLEDLSTTTVYPLLLKPVNFGQLLPNNATFVARGACATVGDKFFKMSPSSQAWDSDVRSIEAYSSGCVLKWRFGTDGAFNAMMGFNSDPLTDQSYVSIDFAVYGRNGASGAEVYESGTQVPGLFIPFTSATVFSMTYDGVGVRYFKDGTLFRGPITATNKVFFMDSSFYEPQSTVESVFFGLLSSGSSPRLISRGQCTTVGNTIQKVGGVNAWDSDCFSGESFTACALSFRCGLLDTQLMVGLNTDPASSNSYETIDYAFYCVGSPSPNPRIYVYESGVGFDMNMPYSVNTVFSIRYDGNWVRYYVNGVSVRERYAPKQTFFLDSSFASPGGSALDVEFGALNGATPAPYVAFGNCLVSDDKVFKNGGPVDWNSSVNSIAGFPQCHVQFKATQTNGYVMVALNSDPTTDTSYSSLDFAWYCTDSGLAIIYESGSNVPGIAFTYTTSTVFAITYDGANVRYYSDRVLLRTVPLGGATLFMDSSIYTPGAGFHALTFGPGATLPTIDTQELTNNAVSYSLSAFNAGPITLGASGGGASVTQVVRDVLLLVLIPQASDATLTVTAVYEQYQTGVSGPQFTTLAAVINGIRTQAARISYISTSAPFGIGAGEKIAQTWDFNYPANGVGWVTLEWHSFPPSFGGNGGGFDNVSLNLEFRKK